jgi:hypothetical protein
MSVQRTLDLPTEHVTVCVQGDDPEHVDCNLPIAATQTGRTRVFEHGASPLPAGHVIEFRLGAVPIPLEAYARWVAAGLLGLIVLVTLVRRVGRRPSSPADTGVSPTIGGQPPHAGRKRRRRRRSASSAQSR